MNLELSRRRLITAALLAAGLQTAALGTMMASNAAVLADGKPVLLRTVPVDPRDLLRGDYVVLNYEFTNFDSALIADPWPTAPGQQQLWVELAPAADGYWHPLRAAFSSFAPSEGNVVLRSQSFAYTPQGTKPSTVHAEFGLERYYVPEGEGKAIEEARNGQQVAIEARVAEDGTARIADLKVVDAPAPAP